MIHIVLILTVLILALPYVLIASVGMTMIDPPLLVLLIMLGYVLWNAVKLINLIRKTRPRTSWKPSWPKLTRK